MSAALESSGDLTHEQARAVVGRIRQHVACTAAEVKVAYEGRAWIALGYESWGALCEVEFADFRLTSEARHALVADLRTDGMSTRAIAAVAGVDRRTVRRDLADVGRDAPRDSDDEPVDAEVIEARPIVVGLDGKRYPPPAPRPAPDWRSDDPADVHEGHIRRSVKRLEMFCSSWHQFRDLRDLPDREEILARLVDSDRQIIAAAEEIVWNR